MKKQGDRGARDPAGRSLLHDCDASQRDANARVRLALESWAARKDAGDRR